MTDQRQQQQHFTSGKSGTVDADDMGYGVDNGQLHGDGSQQRGIPQFVPAWGQYYGGSNGSATASSSTTPFGYAQNYSQRMIPGPFSGSGSGVAAISHSMASPPLYCHQPNSPGLASDNHPLPTAKRKAASNPHQVSKLPKKVSCTSCRTRKIKCDGLKPLCGACNKKGLPTELCIYDSAPWISTVYKERQLSEEIELLRKQNATLTKDVQNLNSQRIQLHTENMELRAYALRASENSAVGLNTNEWEANSNTEVLDMALNFPFREEFVMLENFALAKDSSLCIRRLVGPTSWRAAISVDKKMKYIFEQVSKTISKKLSRMEDEFPLTSVAGTTFYDSEASKAFPLDQNQNRNIVSWGRQKILEKVLAKFPDPIVFRIHIENFFSGIACQLCPGLLDKNELLDNFENAFAVNLREVHGFYDKTKPYEYQLRPFGNDIVYSNISEILMVMKMSMLFGLNEYQTRGSQNLTDKFPFFDCSYQVRRCFTSFKDNDPTHTLFTSIEMLLSLGKVKSFPCLPAMNTMFLLYLYSIYGPNFCSEVFTDSNSSVLGLTVHMALKLGLHRNIELLYSHEQPDKRRRIKQSWVFILAYDGRRSLVTGHPLLINESYIYKYDDVEEVDYDTADLETRENVTIIRTVSLMRDIMNDILCEKNKTALNVKLQINKLALYKNKYFLSTLSRSLKGLSEPNLCEGEIHFYLRQVKNFLHLYALQHSLHIMLYLTYENEGGPTCPEGKEKYFLLTLRYSILQLLSVNEVGRTISKLCRASCANNEWIYYLLPAMKECELRAVFFILSIVLRDLHELKNSTTPIDKTSINSITSSQNIHDLTFEDLELNCMNDDLQELRKMRTVLSKDNTFITLRFLSNALEEIWTQDIEIAGINKEFMPGLELIRGMFVHLVHVLKNFDTSGDHTSLRHRSQTQEAIREKQTNGRGNTDNATSDVAETLPTELPSDAGLELVPELENRNQGRDQMPLPIIPEFSDPPTHDYISSTQSLHSNPAVQFASELSRSENVEDLGGILYDEMDTLLTMDAETFTTKFRNDLLGKYKTWLED